MSFAVINNEKGQRKLHFVCVLFKKENILTTNDEWLKIEECKKELVKK
jgi:hypothetical protein